MGKFTPPENRMPEKVIALQAKLAQVRAELKGAEAAARAYYRQRDELLAAVEEHERALDDDSMALQVDRNLYAVARRIKGAARAVPNASEPPNDAPVSS